LNARYYDSARGQFLSQDPVFWEIGQTSVGKGILLDPQLLNGYAYAIGNPITGKDADGRLVELISRPLIDRGGGLLAHSFVAITPTNPSTIGQLTDINHSTGERQNINTSAPFTLSGFTDGKVLFKEANAVDDYNRMSAKCGGCASIIVSPPSGVSDEEFERRIVSSFNGLPEDIDPRYGRTGMVRLTGAPNSNNAATTYLMGGGVGAGQINAYQSALYASNGLVAPGLGRSATGNSVAQSAGNTLNSLLSKLSGLLKQISAALPKRN
jgi:RHS repeat-associated protein